jgi:hypothetical protein
METVAAILPESRYSKLSVLTCVVLIWFHIQAIAAFWSFSWTNLSAAVALYCIATGLGISMGYHRLHTHRGFKTYKWFEYFLAICGTLTLEGGPIFWVATHRLHHQHSDKAEDPHSPRVSGFWAHLGWMLFGEAHHSDTKLLLGPAHRARVLAPRDRGMGARQLGDLPPRRAWSAFDLARQLRHAHVGRPPLRDHGRFAKPVVGCAADVRRRLAQQPSRPPHVLAPWSCLVRVRSHLAPAQGTPRGGSRLGCPRRQSQPDPSRRSRRLIQTLAVRLRGTLEFADILKAWTARHDLGWTP